MSCQRRPLQNLAPGISGAEAYWAIDAAEPSGAAVGRAALLAGDRRADAGRAPKVWPPERNKAALRPSLARLQADVWSGPKTCCGGPDRPR
jgi:hypothetical protein